MTPRERKIASALSACTFCPASWDKRFARIMGEHVERQPEVPLTERQATQLLRLAHKYRRQIGAVVLEHVLDEA